MSKDATTYTTTTDMAGHIFGRMGQGDATMYDAAKGIDQDYTKKAFQWYNPVGPVHVMLVSIFPYLASAWALTAG